MIKLLITATFSLFWTAIAQELPRQSRNALKNRKSSV
jgi:hypothetical protein